MEIMHAECAAPGRSRCSWPPRRQRLGHMIQTSRGPDSGQVRLPHPPRDPGPALPGRGARERCSAPPESRPSSCPLADAGAQSTPIPRPVWSGLVCGPWRPGGAPLPVNLRGPRGPAALPPDPDGATRGRGRKNWSNLGAQEAGPRSPPPRPNREGVAPSPPREARAGPAPDPGGGLTGVRGLQGRACVLTNEPDSEHQLGVRHLGRSHLPPQQRAAPKARSQAPPLPRSRPPVGPTLRLRPRPHPRPRPHLPGLLPAPPFTFSPWVLTLKNFRQAPQLPSISLVQTFGCLRCNPLQSSLRLSSFYLSTPVHSVR